ncbi:hypothetical protein HPB50_021174 [Hyalomma asiaticum]|uniref:Uncharacterized protein n=1 Tax=Hyalomma asiaticum TaxID=266040 RepID=A0ACB7RYX8_HYAAI|nr:hypothetical protein HPB50_021174 [Hyalomma asiaticum]
MPPGMSHKLTAPAEVESQAAANMQWQWLLTYVNKEGTSTKTSVENVWKRPSAKQLGMYNKGVLFSKVYPPKPPYQKLARQSVSTAIIDSNCPLGIMLRQEQEIAENLAHLDKVLGRLEQPSNIFGAESIPVEEVSDDFILEVVVTEEERNDIAKQTILQSGCPQWHCARALRISASSKAHHIKIRQADFESLAQQLVTPRSFKSAACAYGISKEPVARKEYESKTGRKVIQVGLVISTLQPWLCCSPDGLTDEEGIRLLEIKAPYSCQAAFAPPLYGPGAAERLLFVPSMRPARTDISSNAAAPGLISAPFVHGHLRRSREKKRCLLTGNAEDAELGLGLNIWTPSSENQGQRGRPEAFQHSALMRVPPLSPFEATRFV